jgi:hypothetical protein
MEGGCSTIEPLPLTICSEFWADLVINDIPAETQAEHRWIIGIF